eukprot:Rmarinus@m.1547
MLVGNAHNRATGSMMGLPGTGVVGITSETGTTIGTGVLTGTVMDLTGTATAVATVVRTGVLGENVVGTEIVAAIRIPTRTINLIAVTTEKEIGNIGKAVESGM